MRVLVVGLARTGVATALFCARHNAIVTATESRPESDLGDAPAKLREAGVTLELGGHVEKTFLAQDLIIPSPGVPADDHFLQAARSKGITIWGEIELAFFPRGQAHRYYRLQWQNDHNNSDSSHFEKRPPFPRSSPAMSAPL